MVLLLEWVSLEFVYHALRCNYFCKIMSTFKLSTKYHLFRLFSIGVFFFLQACSDKTGFRDPLVEFQKSISLSSKELKSSDSLFRAGSIILFEDILIVQDDDLKFLYKIIDVNKDQILKKFGKIGQGPCELEPQSITSRSGSNGEVIGIFEMQTSEYLEFPINQILESEEDPACNSFQGKFGPEIRLAIQVGDNLFLGAGSSEKPYALLSGNQLVQTIGEYPFQSQFQGIDPIIIDLAFQNRLYKNPIKPLMLSTSSFSFNMDILELENDENLIIKKSLHYWPPEFEPSNEPNQFYAAIKEENKFGNVSTAVSEKYIYVLYSDEPWKYQFPIKSKRVLVYDWDGNAVKIINLDKEVNMIAAHEKDDYLIGYLDDGKANLFRFEME